MARWFGCFKVETAFAALVRSVLEARREREEERRKLKNPAMKLLKPTTETEKAAESQAEDQGAKSEVERTFHQDILDII